MNTSRNKKLIKIEKGIKFLVKEIIPITIGILIALFINNWNENQKDKKYIHKILTSVNEELMETSKSIVKNIPNQKRLMDTIDVYLLDNKTNLLEVIVKGDGIHIPTIKTNSWKAISNSKIELLEYDLMSSLANIEESKALLKLQSNNIINYIYINVEETGKYKKMTLKFMMRDIIMNVENIEKEIQEIIKQMPENKKGNQ